MVSPVKVILILLFVTTKGQDIYEKTEVKPEKCYGTDEVMARQCCIFPPFFERLSAKQCGSSTSLMFQLEKENVSAFRRNTIRTCDHWKCLLGKYYLLDEENFVNIDKYYDHLDKWVNLNPAFSNAILGAKVHCKQFFRILMPLEPCDFFSFQTCLRHYVNLNCPHVISSKECHEWKEFYEECREYYI